MEPWQLWAVLCLHAVLTSASDVEMHPPPDFFWVLALLIGLFGGVMLVMAVWSFATKYRQFYGVSEADVFVPAPALSHVPQPSARSSVHLPPDPEPSVPPERKSPEPSAPLEPQRSTAASAPTSPTEEISGWKLLGQGQYTMVSRCTLDGRDVAVKSFLDTSPGHLEVLHKELAALMRLSHPRLVLVVEAITEPLMVVMEHCGQGTFHQYLRSTLPKLAVSVQMVLSAVDGLVYLAEQGVMHGFLSAHNCFVVNDDESRAPALKLSDYGLGREYVRRAIRPRVFEWGRWQPPELLLEDAKCDPIADMYSCGVLLWEALTFGVLPYGDLNAAQARQAILAGCLLPVPARCPLQLHTILQWCWRYDPSERPLARALQEHLSSAHHALVLSSRGVSPPAVSIQSSYSSPRVLPVEANGGPLSPTSAGSALGVHRRARSTAATSTVEARVQALWRTKTPPPPATQHDVAGSGLLSPTPFDSLDRVAAGISMVRQPPQDDRSAPLRRCHTTL